MFKKYLTLILAALLINLSMSGASFAETKAEKENKIAEKVKIDVSKLGTGKDARIQVKLKDGTKLKGYISQINENSFVVIEDKTGSSTEVSYPNAKQVRGNNLNTGVKIVIGVGIALALIALVAFIANSID